MIKEVTWRVYLDEIVRHKSPAEKKQLYDAVQVTRTAFQRWRSGENTPDAAHVTLLLKALPDEEREHLHSLMMDDPKARALLPMEMALQGGQATDRIPQEIYEEVLRLSRDTPDRFWLLCSTILVRALSQIETHPKQTGVEISIARCMPPRSNGKVRSLREYAGRGTPPWRGDLHTKDYFLGAESLAGCAVMQRHGIMVPDLSKSDIIAPVHWMEYEMSCAAYPILREGCIAGALIVSCCVPDFFTQEKLILIEKYADLIRLAFYDQEFYPASSIDLGLMPSWKVQQQYFCSFRQRVNDEYKRSIREGQPLQELAQVEERVRETLEGELLQLASLSDEEVTV
jgi:GAF domain-containing protein